MPKLPVQIVNGIFQDAESDFRTRYPRNLVPVPKRTGIANGYLRPSDGIELFSTGPGVDRGGILYEDLVYRVMGDQLVTVAIDGGITSLGNVDGTTLSQVSLEYSFTDLGVVSNNRFFLYNETDGLRENTDPDLGNPIDLTWIDGYFALTDGEFIFVTDLGDPLSIDPNKYAASEIDPDPVVAVLSLRNELVAVNRYTIEFFSNIGGSGFPFQRIDGAQITNGAIGTHAVTIFMEQLAFLGGQRNETNAIYMASRGTENKISTREIDEILEDYTDQQLASVVMEERKFRNHEFLYVHLPDQCLVFDGSASQALGAPVWFTLDSGLQNKRTYRARNMVYAYNRYIFGDPTSNTLGTFDYTISSQYGDMIGWEFGTPVIYNDANGAIINSQELTSATGTTLLGEDPVIISQFSDDGINYSQPMRQPVGKQGDRANRIKWWRMGRMADRRMIIFSGTSDAHISPARLTLDLEPLAW